MKFAVVGTGVIGSGWITRMLAHGHEVIATDPSEGAYERMLTQVKQNWPYAEQMGLAENASIQNLTFTPHLEEAVKETTVKAEQIYESIGMDVLHVRHEIEGHIADRLMEALWRESLHIVNDGIATTEEVDKAFTHAAGLRYAQYGPFMTFHLAGGEGGMRHMLKQFGPALKKPWTKLIAPELTDDLYHKVVNGSEASSQGYTMSELDQKRNEFLIKVKELAEQYWPSDSKEMKKSNGAEL